MPEAAKSTQVSSLPRFQLQRDFHLAQHKRRVHLAIVPENVTIDDVLKPGYWKNVAAKLAPFDIIEILAEDGTWEAELRVTRCEEQWAKVVVRHGPLQLETADKPETEASGYTLKWSGARKWRIIRDNDGAVIKEDLPTKGAAQVELDELLKKLPASVA